MINLSILQVGETRTDPISHVFPSAVWAQGRERLLPELLCKLAHLAHLSPIFAFATFALVCHLVTTYCLIVR